jgi:hypothetical protein
MRTEDLFLLVMRVCYAMVFAERANALLFFFFCLKYPQPLRFSKEANSTNKQTRFRALFGILLQKVHTVSSSNEMEFLIQAAVAAAVVEEHACSSSSTIPNIQHVRQLDLCPTLLLIIFTIYHSCHISYHIRRKFSVILFLINK